MRPRRLLRRTGEYLEHGLNRGWFAACDNYYRFANRRQPRLLIYTDSRGFDVVRRRRSISYVALLRRKYHVTYEICPEKFTTLLDFVNFMAGVTAGAYEAIIVQCGIVDFSPRPLSSLARLQKNKRDVGRFAALFAANCGHYASPAKSTYYGEPTATLYSEQYLRGVLLPELTHWRNLVWINANHFVPGWDGNHARGRPENIDEVVSAFDVIMQRYLPTTVNLKNWSCEDIREYTIDNIHYTREGFARVASLIDEEVTRLVGPSVP